MSSLIRRERPMFADVMNWLDDEWPFRSMPRLGGEAKPIRVEDYVEDDHYVLRAEAPGIDPDKDVEITIHDGVLTVHGQRREEAKEGQRSEFRYGAFMRSVRLPEGTDADDIKATYADGILEVRAGIKPEQKPETKRVQITH